MSSSTVKRQSAAVMFTDIAGYTSIMASDEEKALSLLQDKRKILKPLIKQHDGVYVKGTGDGTLSYFDSAYNASKCAKRFQESIYDNKNMNVRVGIHVGDIVLDDGDVYGDGVNVASRLESMSPVGGICVSNTVYDELRNKKDFDGVELGLQSLKGVGRLIEIYGLKGDLLTEPKPSDYQDNKVAVHSDDEVPSIAIIPFDNKGANEDVFYAYGISADLISDCSGAGLLRVAGLKEVEELGDIPFKEKAKKLFVRYVVTGSLWKMDNMFQLSMELYDTKESKVVWSDRWQEKWDNLPTIKGGLSEGLIKALNTNSKIRNKIDTHDKQAYEYYLKAKYKHRFRQSMEDIEIVRELLIKAIDIDKNFVQAISLLAETYFEAGKFNKALDIYNEILFKAKNNNDLKMICSINYGLSGIYLYQGDYNKSLNYEESNLIIYKKTKNQDGIARTLSSIGINYRNLGNYEKALKYYNQSYKIEKTLGNQVNMAIVLGVIGNHYLNVGKYDKSLDYNYRSLKLLKQINHFRWITYAQNNLGETLIDMKEYQNAINHLNKAYNMRKKLNLPSGHILISATLLALAKKYLQDDYNNSEIKLLIRRAEYIKHDLNYRLYLLIENTFYLETAYNQVQEKADNLEPDVAKKFLSYPIPKAIVEEWEKVK